MYPVSRPGNRTVIDNRERTVALRESSFLGDQLASHRVKLSDQTQTSGTINCWHARQTVYYINSIDPNDGASAQLPA